LPNVYGPGDYLDTTRSHALNGIITRMIENKDNNFNIWGTGKPKREWLYVSDISRIIKIVLNKKKFFKDFDHINVAQNQSYSINFIAKLVKKFLNYKVRLINDLTYPDGALLKQLDNKKFKKYFNNFAFTTFNVGLSETIKYYQKVIKL
jgi:GDP-L-fucose synthase